MSSEPQASSLLSTSLASASSLVLLQLFSRLFTFALNQALVRLVSPQVFGTAAIQFELLLSTILFLSREGVRNALLRASTQRESKKKQSGSGDPLVTNIALLPVFLGVPVTILSALLYIKSSSSSTASQPHFHLSVAIYALAAFFELLSEPLYIRAQNELRFDARMRAEGTAVVLKTVTAFLVLVIAPPEWALVAFAVGQLAYGLAMLSSFLRIYGGQAEFWPKRVKVTVHGNTKVQYFDSGLLQLSAAMSGQSVIKHFLTEGDKFLVSTLSPLADQGGYAIASNYGSLVARIVFQPIEETSRVFFSKTLSASDENSPSVLQTAATLLHTILLLFTHLLLLLTTFAPPYLPLVTSILLPARYQATSAPAILNVYIYYIPMMAFNGVLEAFFASTATPTDLRVQSRWLLIFSCGFVGVAVGLSNILGMGDTGLVWANVVNLAVRALYAWIFVRKFFESRGSKGMVSWRNCVPPFGVLVVFAVSAFVTRWSYVVFQDAPLTIRGQLGHIGAGVSCVMCCLGASGCYYSVLFERSSFQQIYVVLRRR